MSLFNKGVLTKKGQALIAKSEARGRGIKITKVTTGNGVHQDTSVAALENVTALISPKQTFAITSIEQIIGNEGVAMITVILHNRGLEELYVLNELGVWAEDPDEGEILYSLLVSTDNNIYLPADNGTGGISAIREQIYLEVTNSESTIINTTGAVIGRDEYAALYALVERMVTGLRGGTTGQRLTKTGDDDFAYGWDNKSTFTGPVESFPEEGQKDTVYIDTDSAEIYVWKEIEEGEMGYFKLPLGSEASQTLQAQITANRNAITLLQGRTSALEHMHDEVTVTVPTASWAETEEDDMAVFTQEIAVTGMTAEKKFDVLAKPQSQSAAALEAEQKAIGVFFGHGTVEGGAGKITLSCRKKKPAANFGIVIRGDMTASGGE